MSTPDEEASISLPSIAFVTILGFLIYRYFFSGTSPSRTSAAAAGGGPRYTSAQVDQIVAMFPQLSRRDVMWDLHRNRGSVQATTERVLRGGRLEQAPLSFQPLFDTTSTPTTSTTGSGVPVTPTKVVVEPDLITRYNLQGKVGAGDKGKEKEEPNHGWASSKDERQAMLKRRRDEMILAARRKMQERDAAGTVGQV